MNLDFILDLVWSKMEIITYSDDSRWISANSSKLKSNLKTNLMIRRLFQTMKFYSMLFLAIFIFYSHPDSGFIRFIFEFSNLFYSKMKTQIFYSFFFYSNSSITQIFYLFKISITFTYLQNETVFNVIQRIINYSSLWKTILYSNINEK